MNALWTHPAKTAPLARITSTSYRRESTRANVHAATMGTTAKLGVTDVTADLVKTEVRAPALVVGTRASAPRAIMANSASAVVD